MDPGHLHLDERLIESGCVYCGCSLVDAAELERLRLEGPESEIEDALSRQRTRDHVPSRAFLDEPFPPNLPVVGCCRACNNGFSLDEQYLACLVECVVCGGVEPELFERARVSHMLRGSVALFERLSAAERRLEDGPAWEMEGERVRRIVLKLAKGHAAFEHQWHLPEPNTIAIAPLHAMREDERAQFEQGDSGLRLLPELGSMALRRTALSAGTSQWVEVQHGRYRYTSAIYLNGFSVRLVIREYLACEVWWDEAL